MTVSQLLIEHWALSLLSIAVAYGLFKASQKPPGPLPPGPKGLPILGNIFQLEGKDSYHTFTKWRDEYGPIFSLNLAGMTLIILNSHKVTGDLMDRRSNIYSDRPRLIMALEILSGGLLISAAPYGDLWRRLRKAAHEVLNIRAAEDYYPLQEQEGAALVNYMFERPDIWDDNFKQSAASTLLSATYGLPPIADPHDPLIERINDHMHRTSRAGLPGAYFVEIFTWMKHLPEWMAKWKRDGLRYHREDTEMFENFLGGVQKDMDQQPEAHTKCLAASLIERNNLNKKEAAWLAGTMFGAGAETTAAALTVFMLAMVLYPDVQKKAQAELDEVVGRDRMPTFEDRQNLPYFRAMVKEVLRWRPPGPLGVPHRTTADDWYEGYFIPKGAVVITNVWAMNRDPEVFPDFDEFRPDRFLDESNIPKDTHGQGHVTFGAGRRICVGMNVANNALFIDMACLLWAMTIENGGKTLPSRTETTDEGLIVRPMPFEVKVTERYPDVRKIVAETSGRKPAASA